ncbi:uncharacterized protein BP5553_04614 [Venustampulla echinocandica]|uniref:Gpi anchored protein n=1 Tax=Venustampulla echinocandica TaxID=2656787 RepID=A0A370TNT5_9HELO|nr:uncharacterized protein BP5553_04614 [Venustampulla echinocandica]RDL37181.1 hypothetical protein BP5553_04614 [Venustampulla echinocandica]
MFSCVCNIVVLVFVLCSIANASVIEGSEVVLRSLPKNQSPKLVAVAARPGLQIRDESFTPNRHCLHHYAENTPSFDGGRTRFAKTATKYKLPALVLEDIEMALDNVQCFASTITVEFSNKQTLAAARESWDHLEQFLIITSHPGCNMDGERTPYLVSGIIYGKETSKVAFSVKRLEWGDAYDSMKVSFGTTASQYPPSSFRSHEGLRRRAATSSKESSPASPTDATNANSSIHSANIGFRVPAQQNLLGSGILSNSVSDVLAVKCKECTLNGNIDIAEGEFTLGNSTTDVGKAVDFINSGFFRAVANNMSAHVLLDISLTLSKPQTWSKILTEITLPGFEIPGIAAVGPMFRPVVQGSIAMQGKLDFQYGFDMKVPDNSSITLNIGNLTQSSASGFKDTKINAIPFTATSPEVSLKLGLGLRAELLLGIDILSGRGDINAGAFFDLPSLQVTISATSGVDSNCEPASNITSVAQLASNIFPNLTHIVGTAEIDTGLQAAVAMNIPNVISISTASSTALAATTFTLPTACLSFNAAEKAFVSPTPTPTTTVTTSPGGKGGSAPAKAAADSAGNAKAAVPFTNGGPVWWSGAMLLAVFFVALSL